jgi:photosystem II stability/assembly factor-like uncharacterized protein
MHNRRFPRLLWLILGMLITLSSSAQVPSSFLQGLRWRSIGPDRGGRVTAVAGVPADRLTYYMGATGGGVWKTVNAGVTWTPISDRYFKTGSVGAIAVAESDPNVVYVGMGEACLRSNISHGDGVYKSTDAGRTWQNVGLRDSSQIGRMWVDPKDPDRVYVAAIGHPYGPNEERGVFRSTDGGKSWKKILYVNDKTGAADISVDPSNTHVIYASTWQMLRRPWDIYEFGEGSGIYKSTDGGDTWSSLKNGLPQGPLGKIGLAVSPADPKRIWATIGAEQGGGVYRSDDAGATWQLVNDGFEMHSRQYYYGHIFADPQQRDAVYTFSAKDFQKSTDGGKMWTRIQTPHGDYHGLWIDPGDNQRMVNGNDGGATVTFDGGKSWTSEMNQATAQFYTVRTDTDFPYRVYGAQQDNTTVSISSAGGGGGRGGPPEFTEVGGGESGYVVPAPNDSNIIYAGAYWGLLTRFDRRAGTTRNITVWPDYPGGRTGSNMKYRFQWTFPIAISPADPSAVYVGGNVVFKSVNGGQSWTPISRDLTRADKEKINGGRLEDIYGTVFSLAVSPIDKGVIWAGSDDGLIHLTRDGGRTWNNVTPPDVQPWTRINIIESSPHDAATAYVAANRYQMDDFKPYIYRTHDYGKTWTLVTNGVANDAFVRTVRQDPVRPQLLYAGTETGVYVSFDGGDHWQNLQLNLPVVPVTDLVVKENDLVISTQGRAFWILDDVAALQQITPEVLKAQVQLFQPRPAYRAGRRGGFGFAGGAPDGVVVDYYLAQAPSGPITLEFLDSSGKLIKSFSSTARPAEEAAGPRGNRGQAPNRSAAPSQAGMNRFVWDMRYPDAEALEGARTFLFGGSLRGPEAAPGHYSVRLSAGGQTSTQAFEIRKDPRVPTTQQDYQKQLAFLLAVRDKLSATHRAINQIRRVEQQVTTAVQKSNDASLANTAQKIEGDLSGDLQRLYEPRFTGYDDQTLIYPLRLNNRIAALQNYAGGEFPLTDQATQVFAELSSELDQTLAHVKQTIDRGVPQFNSRLKELGLPSVNVAEPAATSGGE